MLRVLILELTIRITMIECVNFFQVNSSMQCATLVTSGRKT